MFAWLWYRLEPDFLILAIRSDNAKFKRKLRCEEFSPPKQQVQEALGGLRRVEENQGV